MSKRDARRAMETEIADKLAGKLEGEWGPEKVADLTDAIVAKLAEWNRVASKPAPAPVECLSSPEEIAAGRYRFAAQVSPEVIARLVFVRYMCDAGLGIAPMSHERVTAWLEADVPTFRRFLDEVVLAEPLELSTGVFMPTGSRMWALKPDRIYLTLNIGP